MQSVEIKILGRKFYFKSDEPEKLKKYAKYINSQLETLNQRFNTVDQAKLYVLLSMMLTEKYFQALENNQTLKKEIKNLDELLNKIDL